eukprot:m.107794 g.107794  ORF g.107794 m.107794 type:complete len:171 (-) comp12774_c0_seq1:35-547(-)
MECRSSTSGVADALEAGRGLGADQWVVREVAALVLVLTHAPRRPRKLVRSAMKDKHPLEVADGVWDDSAQFITVRASHRPGDRKQLHLSHVANRLRDRASQFVEDVERDPGHPLQSPEIGRQRSIKVVLGKVEVEHMTGITDNPVPIVRARISSEPAPQKGVNISAVSTL